MYKGRFFGYKDGNRNGILEACALLAISTERTPFKAVDDSWVERLRKRKDVWINLRLPPFSHPNLDSGSLGPLRLERVAIVSLFNNSKEIQHAFVRRPGVQKYFVFSESASCISRLTKKYVTRVLCVEYLRLSEHNNPPLAPFLLYVDK